MLKRLLQQETNGKVFPVKCAPDNDPNVLVIVFLTPIVLTALWKTWSAEQDKEESIVWQWKVARQLKS